MIMNGYDYISERDFDQVWKARAKVDGDLYSFDEIKSFPIEYVWTVTESEDLDEDGFSVDNNWYASPGIFVINALGYLTTERPWEDDTQDAIWYLDDDDRAREDRRRVFTEHSPGAVSA